MKRVPKSFQLAGYTIEVRLVDAATLEAAASAPDCYGCFKPDELCVYLAKPTRKLKSSVVLQTFFHELFHAIFWVANHVQDDDDEEERLVDQFGHLMHQVLSSAKY